MKLEHSDRFWNNHQLLKFMKMYSVGA